MRVLITGATGFAGRHLGRLAVSKKAKVFGLCRRKSQEKCPKGVTPIIADLLDRQSLVRALRRSCPDRIYHLAGQASVADSWKNPAANDRVNIEGTRRLFEALHELKMRPRVLISGSAEVYGPRKNTQPIRETSVLRPNNPYATSKLIQEIVALHHMITFGVPVIRTRSFNHMGPGQSDRFVASSFAEQCARIQLGLAKPSIRVGNLNAKRDFTDVRDVACAYWAAMEKGMPGEVYNVASGQARPIRKILEYYLGRVSARISVERDAARMRAKDLKTLVGDASKLRRMTGWKPSIRFEATLEDIFTDWLRELRLGKK